MLLENMDFLNNDDSDHGDSFKINQDYAKRYDKWRKSEELQKRECFVSQFP